MKLYAFYFSPTGGTKRVLDDVLTAWDCEKHLVDLADRAADWRRLGLWGARLMFTTERASECVQVLDRYLEQNRYQPSGYTRGLYYREVE